MKKTAKLVNTIGTILCASVVFIILVSYSCSVCVVEGFTSKILRVRNVILMSSAILMALSAIVTSMRLDRVEEKAKVLPYAFVQIAVACVVLVTLAILCFVGGDLAILEFIKEETIGWILVAAIPVCAAGGVLTLFVKQDELH